MGFYDAFFGSDQSQYTAYAIVAAIIAICITILLTATDIPVSNRLLIVFFVIISLVPSVFLTLFELTCIVTGGTEPNKWWCYAFAWVLAAFIIIYCIFIVIISLISLFTYNNAIDNVTETETKSRLSPEVSNNYAKQMIANDDNHAKQVEKFYNEQMNEMNNEMNTLLKKNEKPELYNPANLMQSIANQIPPPPSSELFANAAHQSSPQSSPQLSITDNKPHKDTFNNATPMQAPISKFSNYSELSSTEAFSDDFFPYDKFAAN